MALLEAMLIILLPGLRPCRNEEVSGSGNMSSSRNLVLESDGHSPDAGIFVPRITMGIYGTEQATPSLYLRELPRLSKR